ncbi:MAG TPA: phage baseplate assembly protein V [Thermoleophilaceae bacterium]|jgi:uncharacterized protein involved in type VI secretion and phage assembly|nr:phage baseplate assembly protein V [Thermoleophilaceae bacterium]
MSAIPGVAPVAPPVERFYGKYRGEVVDVNDPENQGRIRSKVPEVLGTEESGWALPAAPYAGPGVGTFMIPPVGAAVWMEFEAGLVSRPIYAGCIWGSNDRPQDQDGNGATPKLKIIRSEQGMLVSLDDDGQTINVADQNGSNILKIEVQKGQITLKGASKVVVEAPQIELVENASHPVVFGDDLLQYLQQVVQLYTTHMHPGEMALGVFPVTPMTPVPPLQPPTPSMLSQKVKTG